MQSFATLQDVISLWRPLTPDEQEMVQTLLPVVSDTIRLEAEKVGRDMDVMITCNSALETVVKAVTVDVVKRYVNDNVDGQSMVQTTESALGYSVSGTYLSPGGGIFIKNAELSRLGLKKQRYGVMNIYGDA